MKDVASPYVYQNRARTRSSARILHPFTNSIGEHKGIYEIFRTLYKQGKLSPHAVDAQMDEMFAHDCFDVFNIRLRMKDPNGVRAAVKRLEGGVAQARRSSLIGTAR